MGKRRSLVIMRSSQAVDEVVPDGFMDDVELLLRRCEASSLRLMRSDDDV